MHIFMNKSYFFSKKNFVFFAFVVLVIFVSSPLFAQTNLASISIVSKINNELNDIDNVLKSDNLSKEQLNKLQQRLIDLQALANKEQKRLSPLLEEAKDLFNKLKPAHNKKEEEEGAETKEETEETKQVGELNEQLSKVSLEVSSLQSKITLLNSSMLRIKQFSDQILKAKERHLVTQLLEHSYSIFNSKLWLDGIKGIKNIKDSTSYLFADSVVLPPEKASKTILLAGIMIAVLLLLITLLYRFLFSHLLSHLAKEQNPSPLQKSAHALLSIFIYTLTPFAFFFGAIKILIANKLVASEIPEVTGTIMTAIFFAAFAYGILKALLAPRYTNYRLLQLRTPVSRKIFTLSIILLLSYSTIIIGAIDSSGKTMFVPLETALLIRAISSIVMAVIIWLIYRLIIKETEQLDAEEGSNRTKNISLKTPSFSLPSILSILRPLILPVCVFVILAPTLGYINLGKFLTELLVLLFLTLSLLGILTAFIDNLLTELLKKDNDKVKTFAISMGFKPKTVLILGVLINGVTHIFLYLLTLLILLTPLGMHSMGFLSSLKNAFFQIQLGSLTISPIEIIIAIIVFALVFILVKSLQKWIGERLFPTMKLDTGLEDSINTTIGYLGFIIATMLSFSYLGIDLSKLALVVGALSVGIGFGLQSIVNNFVSGLILLVERPIKKGDWIVVGSEQGLVKKISVRATTIETFNRSTVIVPNAELISNRVINWMYSNNMGRIIIPIGVSYDSDPEQVKEILLQVAKDSDFVNSVPEPKVLFMNFGDSSLDFELRCYINNINTATTSKSNLRFSIFKAFKEANIEIPFPQRDINIHHQEE